MLLERHYSEAEYHQDHLLPQDRTTIRSVQNAAEFLSQASPAVKPRIQAYIELRVKLLSQTLRVEPEVAEALCCLELLEEVGK